MANRLLNINNPIFDTDASAFFTATGITDSIQKMAINQLVIDLKTFGLWTKMYCIYPFVGGTATTHKFNLKDPRDLDAAYRLVFTGGWTHSATGGKPNGTTGYADTKFIPGSVMSITSGSLSYYSRTDSAAGAKAEIGSVNTANSYYSILCKYTGNLAYGGVFDGLGQAVTTITSSGMYIVSRTSSTILKLFKQGATAFSVSYATGALNSIPVSLGALQNVNLVPNNYSDRECAFAHIGDGLTDTDCVNLFTAVQKYQGILSREVYQ